MIREEEETMKRSNDTLKQIVRVAGKIALEVALIILLKRFKGGRLWK
jgi:hypothetical protein